MATSLIGILSSEFDESTTTHHAIILWLASSPDTSPWYHSCDFHRHVVMISSCELNILTDTSACGWMHARSNGWPERTVTLRHFLSIMTWPTTSWYLQTPYRDIFTSWYEHLWLRSTVLISVGVITACIVIFVQQWWCNHRMLCVETGASLRAKVAMKVDLNRRQLQRQVS